MHVVLPLAVAAHCVLLLGMFDVYFKSPIVADLSPAPAEFTAPAKRLVLFVGDGLRADHFFDADYVPYLRSQIMSRGASYGVSHTRVPTESRPGTVALAAGVYEDPAAVFKGWQDNPVPVDSFFNRCRRSFAWGSPDIVHLFSRHSDNVEAWSYNDDEQRFDPNVSLSLNFWVLTEFTSFVNSCRLNSTCFDMLREDKLSFFFHFIGIDMSGHRSKPFSSSYVENIRQVDGIIERISAMFQDIFGDNKTAFVFTSDHGMTNWGSHGDGSLDETKTPLVVWGAGVQAELCPLKGELNSNIKSSWGVEGCHMDVHQADIAVLMSTLVGVEIPTNSMGTLPVKYLNFEHDTLISAMVLNAKQLHVLFDHLELVIQRQVWNIFFYPFTVDSMNMKTIQELGNFKDLERDSAIRSWMIYINQLKQGITYYQTYFQSYLLALLTLSYLGLIGTIIGKLSQISWNARVRKKSAVISYRGWVLGRVDCCFLVVFLLVSVVHVFEGMPYDYYIYAVLPIILWWKAFDYFSLANAIKILSTVKVVECVKGLCWFVLTVELLFLSFFYRWMLSVVIIALGALPLDPVVLAQTPLSPWTITRLVLAVFPLLPPVGMAKHTSVVVVSGVLTLIIVHALNYSLIHESCSNLLKLQTFLIVAALFDVIYVDYCYTYNYGLTSFAQLISWTILIVNFALLLFLPSNPISRLVNVTFAFGIAFLLFTISYESVFFPVLSLFMGMWLVLSCPEPDEPPGQLLSTPHRVFQEAHIGFLYLFLTVFSFFGIGNIDSLNSFDINWVRCFVQVFSPFTMTGLIVLKTLMPFFLVSCFIRLIVFNSRVNSVAILLVTLLLCEVMGLQFLFAVRNEGSWLDIGRSISHYVIMEVTAFCLVVLYIVSGYVVEPKYRSVFR